MRPRCHLVHVPQPGGLRAEPVRSRCTFEINKNAKRVSNVRDQSAAVSKVLEGLFRHSLLGLRLLLSEPRYRTRAKLTETLWIQRRTHQRKGLIQVPYRWYSSDEGTEGVPGQRARSLGELCTNMTALAGLPKATEKCRAQENLSIFVQMTDLQARLRDMGNIVGPVTSSMSSRGRSLTIAAEPELYYSPLNAKITIYQIHQNKYRGRSIIKSLSCEQR